MPFNPNKILTEYDRGYVTLIKSVCQSVCEWKRLNLLELFITHSYRRIDASKYCNRSTKCRRPLHKFDLLH